ncbi:MAG: hypothetical protein ACKPJD_13130, partial [Planctomycetaceae bacterium]
FDSDVVWLIVISGSACAPKTVLLESDSISTACCREETTQCGQMAGDCLGKLWVVVTLPDLPVNLD